MVKCVNIYYVHRMHMYRPLKITGELENKLLVAMDTDMNLS